MEEKDRKKRDKRGSYERKEGISEWKSDTKMVARYNKR